jgi:hypothetical protein
LHNIPTSTQIYKFKGKSPTECCMESESNSENGRKAVLGPADLYS